MHQVSFMGTIASIDKRKRHQNNFYSQIQKIGP